METELERQFLEMELIDLKQQENKSSTKSGERLNFPHWFLKQEMPLCFFSNANGSISQAPSLQTLFAGDAQ